MSKFVDENNLIFFFPEATLSTGYIYQILADTPIRKEQYE